MILSLVKRNLKLYFRDKASVFFSLLGVIIVLFLYLVFLGDLVSGGISDLPGMEAATFVNSWIMGGVIAVTTVTTTLGAFETLVADRERGIINDFKVSPIKRSSLVLSYVISSLIVGVIMSLFAFTFAEGYILLSGGDLLSFNAIIKALGLIILSVLMSSAVIFFIISFIKSSNAFGAISTVFGSIVGFLMGVYVPLGNLGTVASLVKAFPFAHTAVLMRQVLIYDSLTESAREIPEIDGLLDFLGIQFKFGNHLVTVTEHILLMLGITIIFFLLGILSFSKKRK